MTTPTQMPESLKVPDTPHGAWLWEFLDGASGYMGVFFGEPHPKHGGRYWWRRFVREEVSALQSALKDRDAEIERLKKDAERTARNRDMWKGQCERQAAQLGELRAKGGPYADQA